MLASADRSDVKYMVFSSIAAFYQVDVSGHTCMCVYVYSAAPVQITIFGAIYNICNILNKRKQNLNISNFSVVFKYKFNQYQYIIHGRKVKNGNVSFQHKALI